MYVNVAVLKETRPHERRVALVPSVAAKLVKLGAKLHMQSGAADAIKLCDAAFNDVAFVDDRNELVDNADVVLAVQPPALDVITAMKEGAVLISFIYTEKEPALVRHLLDDLSAKGGGNCVDTQPGETVRIGQVMIVAPLNVSSLLGEDASELYAKNQYHLLALMLKDNVIKIDWDDEILAKTALTHAGKLCTDSGKHAANPKQQVTA